jgi:hypothetical protein
VILAAALLTLASLSFSAQAGGIDALIEQGRYTEALVAIDGLDGPQGHSYRTRTLHQAGDLLGAYEAGLDGLDETPDDLQLLLSTVDVALAVEAPAVSDLTGRLSAAVAALPPDAEHRSWWEGKALEYRELVAELEGGASVRVGAERRARWVAGLGLAGAGLLLLFLSRRRAIDAVPSVASNVNVAPK